MPIRLLMMPIVLGAVLMGISLLWLGVAKDLPLERWYREIRIRRIGEGPSEVQKHVVARDILGAGLR